MSLQMFRNHATWIVQRISTGKVLAVYDRKLAAVQYVDAHPGTKWIKVTMNQEV